MYALLSLAIKELSALGQYFDLNTHLLDNAVRAILAHGKVILIATGKPFYVSQLAAKIAQSYGLPFHALDATHLRHGDAGLIRSSDLIIYISKSGESEEVLAAAEYLKDMDSLALTCELDSTLQDKCRGILHCPLVQEHSLYGKAPMMSSITFLLVLFELINRVAAQRCSEDVYFSHHPAGAIGAEK